MRGLNLGFCCCFNWFRTGEGLTQFDHFFMIFLCVGLFLWFSLAGLRLGFLLGF